MGLGPELLSGLGESQVIWRGFQKKGLEQGLEGRKDLGHKIRKSRVYYVGSLCFIRNESEERGKLLRDP